MHLGPLLNTAVTLKSSVIEQNDFKLVLLLQREAVEALIQELPKFRLKAVPTDCSECPICLEEFHVGNEVNYRHQVENLIELQFY
jgi:ApbE superfamily uncharacterized protein (UPF0280 family)